MSLDQLPVEYQDQKAMGTQSVFWYQWGDRGRERMKVPRLSFFPLGQESILRGPWRDKWVSSYTLLASKGSLGDAWHPASIEESLAKLINKGARSVYYPKTLHPSSLSPENLAWLFLPLPLDFSDKIPVLDFRSSSVLSTTLLPTRTVF